MFEHMLARCSNMWCKGMVVVIKAGRWHMCIQAATIGCTAHVFQVAAACSVNSTHRYAGRPASTFA